MSSDGLPKLPKIPQLSELPADQVTPVVLVLLEIGHRQQEQIQQLRDEIARLKGEQPKPKIKPSVLEGAQRDKPKGKRPKQRCKRRKTRELTIHERVRIPPEELPEGSRFKGYEDFTQNPQLDGVKCAFAGVQGKAQRCAIVVLFQRVVTPPCAVASVPFTP